MVSVYPCDVHGARIRGALEGLRVTLLRKSTRYSRKLRVCPTDVDEILRTHTSEWVGVDDDGLGTLDQVCTACAREIGNAEERGDCFVYLWRRNRPLEEYYGIYCLNCGDRLVKAFGLLQE